MKKTYIIHYGTNSGDAGSIELKARNKDSARNKANKLKKKLDIKSFSVLTLDGNPHTY